jgi:hypothetical protein
VKSTDGAVEDKPKPSNAGARLRQAQSRDPREAVIGPQRRAVIQSHIKVIMPLVTQWHGVREFAIEAPDGYVITFAERINAQPKS